MQKLKNADTPAKNPVGGLLQLGIVFSTVATALTHIVLAIPETLILFYSITLLMMLSAPSWRPLRRLVRGVLIKYTTLTVVLWMRSGERSLVGYADKVIEVALRGLLWQEDRRTSSEPQSSLS